MQHPTQLPATLTLRSFRVLAAALLVSMSAAACSADPAPAATSPSTASPQAAPAPRQDVAPMQNPTPDPAVTPPDAPAVMYMTYQIDGDGAVSYEVQNGSVATFWFGHTFVLDGKTYYTGFSWDTRERYGKPGEDEAGPETQVNIAEATFLRTSADATKPWKFLGQEWTIGETGAFEKAEDIDGSRKPVEFRTGDGRLLLAMPTSSFSGGISSEGYALLVFNPKHDEDDNRSKVWTFLGTALTGDDNSAACADGDVMPCVTSKGTLSFEAAGQGLPRITVNKTGTTIEGPGKTRPLGPQDNVVYTFDAKAQKYTTP